MDCRRALLKSIILSEFCEEEKATDRKRKKKMWCKQWYLQREKYSHANLLQELKLSAPEDMKNFLRMDAPTYAKLLHQVAPLISRQETQMRKSITPNERLSTTLRFLVSGNSFEDLKFLTGISPQSIGDIVIETCGTIIQVLKDYVKIPKTEEEWQLVAEEFSTRWNFNNCCGAIDGKHVEIKKPAGSGSFYFNYKKSFSIVLLAVVNANYQFLVVEVEANGRASDGGVFSGSKFYEKFSENSLNIPQSAKLPNSNDNLPFVLVADDAIPLKNNIMKPFSGNSLTETQRIFNYRLSRARRIVENAFGMLSSRFRVLLTKINLHPDKVTTIVLACCYLHNFLKAANGDIYARTSVNIENTPSFETQARENPQMMNLQATHTRNPSEEAKQIRNKFADYFVGPGAVEWQNMAIN